MVGGLANNSSRTQTEGPRGQFGAIKITLISFAPNISRIEENRGILLGVGKKSEQSTLCSDYLQLANSPHGDHSQLRQVRTTLQSK